MPPKKTKDSGEKTGNAEKGSKGTFTWTPELHQKLTLLVFQPRTVTVAEYETLAKLIGNIAGGPAPTPGAIRNRLDKIRNEQRAVYGEAGLTYPGGGGGSMPAGTPTKTKVPGSGNGKKRGAKSLNDVSNGKDAIEEEEEEDLHLNKKAKKSADCGYQIKNEILEDFGVNDEEGL
ncbi:uncharacterized protein EI97DRAFT_79040 [Westerdykella ornata]|uniref:Uncharacterized protein n=1 Tax=Westerdykella ornata TaxID=318751 RepID=A0A6A6JG28_WESOR|nr:uncharacterized protein EI97DRAFT_79040 [Westerdykella ornata]KAF2275174.1 hypothetical protein EI97DRAFT_79040 [Westerdykella ornata]